MGMSGYTKLFNSILASTIWRADDKTRLVWITLLAMADKYGVAEGSIPGLADFARVSVPACRRALEALSAPDPDSRSQAQGGSRIEAVEGGWRLVNYPKYRAQLSADERREYLRLHKQRQRAALKMSTTINNVQDMSTTVNDVQDKSTLSTQAEAEAEAEAEAKEEAVRTKDARARTEHVPPVKPSAALRSLGASSEDTFPGDVWLRELQAAYPPKSLSSGHLTEVAFLDEVRRFGTPEATFTVMLANLENHKRGHQWRVKGMIPRLDHWLREGLWQQTHDEHPPEALVNDKTAGTLAAASAILKGPA